MTKTIKFNTGRKYTSEGQLIIATFHDDGVVTFMDHSRGVHGEFSLGTAYMTGFDDTFLQGEVMHHYDHGKAQNTTRAWQDGFMRDGCNSRTMNA